MPRMPDGTNLIKEMTDQLPLKCYLKKAYAKTLAAQGIRLRDSALQEIIGVHDFGEMGGVSCVIKFGDRNLFVSITGLDFKDNGSIDEKIAVYQEARVAWVKQEDRRDLKRGLTKRIKCVSIE